jgi:hypothetical protein
MDFKSILSHVPGIEITDDDDDKRTAVATAPHPQPPAAYQPPPVSPTFSAVSPVGAAVDHNDEAYKRLLDKTDFKSTPVYASIQDFLAPLASIPSTDMSDKVKFKSAVAQAKSHGGLTGDAILQTFDNLKATLQQEGDKFAQFVATKTDKEVAQRQSQIQQLTAQLQSIQTQINQLTSESFDIQQKIDRSKHNFDIAFAARSAELDQEKAQYTNLLQ